MINSDILASVEKISPKIKLKVKDLIEDFIIYRSERGFEGEDYLQLIENPNYNNHNAPHIKKLVARHEYLMAMQENVFD
jgi:hemerythrin